MTKAVARKRLVAYESNPFSLVLSVIPAFWRHFKLFAKAFWLTGGIVLGIIFLISLPAAVTGAAFHSSSLSPLLLILFILMLISTIAVAVTFINSVFINLALVDLDAERLSFWQLVEHSRSYIIPLLGLNLLFGLLLLTLSISLVGIIFIPYLIARYVLAQFIIVHENRPVFGSIARAGELMHGRLLDMLGLLSVVAVFSKVVVGILSILSIAIVTATAAVLVILSRQAWLFVPIILLALPLLLFVVAGGGLICALAYGKRYLQLRAVVVHKLRPQTKVQANVLALVTFFIVFIFVFMLQLIFIEANGLYHNNYNNSSSIDGT